MKKYFATGLVILLPLALTLAVLSFFVNLLTAPFVGLFKNILEYFGVADSGFLFFSASQTQQYASQILILVTLFLVTVLLGVFARWVFFHWILRFSDYILHTIPFINSIYKTCQDVIKTIFSGDGKSFKQVVLVPFPGGSTRAIGFVTQEAIAPFNSANGESLTAVFLPTTPNPTSGFLLIYPTHELVYLDMKVEDALKYIISCGVIATPFKKLAPPQAEKSLT